MKKINLNSVCLIDKFKKHVYFKEKLLNYFKDEKDSLFKVDNYYSDNIYKLDWYNSKNFKREWVQLIFKDLIEALEKFANYLNFEKVIIQNIWFQQYKKNCTHGWHAHGSNFTGVYYVDFKKDDAKTELINFQEDKKIQLNVEEGDIAIFPSFTIHRGSIQKNENLKTIISFNLDFENIEKNFISKINEFK